MPKKNRIKTAHVSFPAEIFAEECLAEVLNAARNHRPVDRTKLTCPFANTRCTWLAFTFRKIYPIPNRKEDASSIALRRSLPFTAVAKSKPNFLENVVGGKTVEGWKDAAVNRPQNRLRAGGEPVSKGGGANRLARFYALPTSPQKP
jgi:hypothetical protein